MIIRKGRLRTLGVNEPIRHESHRRPVSRRDFIAQGFMTGAATVMTGGILSLFANPRAAWAALSPDLEALKAGCGITTLGAGKIPFIAFDNLYTFEADSDKGVWLQEQSRRWDYAEVLGPCTGLPFATRIGVDTRFGGSQLDRTGTLLVDGQRCSLASLTATNGPPPKPGKAKEAKH